MQKCVLKVPETWRKTTVDRDAVRRIHSRILLIASQFNFSFPALLENTVTLHWCSGKIVEIGQQIKSLVRNRASSEKLRVCSRCRKPAIACVSCVRVENRQFHVNAKLMQKCTDERGRKSWRLSEKNVCFKRPTTINLIVQSDDYGNRQLPP